MVGAFIVLAVLFTASVSNAVYCDRVGMKIWQRAVSTSEAYNFDISFLRDIYGVYAYGHNIGFHVVLTFEYQNIFVEFGLFRLSLGHFKDRSVERFLKYDYK